MTSFKKGGFVFYGIPYATKNACMRVFGISDYQLNKLIEAEKQGKPLLLRPKYDEGEMKKRRYFAKKLEECGFWVREERE